MVVVNRSYKVEVLGDKLGSILCGRSYKEEDVSLIPWLGTDSDANMNFFAWSKK